MEPDHGGIQCKTHTHYEMTCDEFEALRARAGGRCEVCRRLPEETGAKKLFIDHDGQYGTAAVRGLLCGRCNNRLGMLENPDYRRSFVRDPRARGLHEYLRNAWFMQITRWARNRPGILDIADAQPRGPIQGAQANTIVRAINTRLGTAPDLTMRTVITEGRIDHEVQARYHVNTGHLVLHFTATGPCKVAYRRAGVITGPDQAEEPFADWRDALARLGA